MTSAPNFPSCVSPQGTVIASYSTGTHGIVGSTATYSGSDVVYRLSDEALTQCFCSVDGAGIQTNWWKSSSLSQEQVDTLISQGWQYVPSGDLWGLTVDPYLVKNSNYSCLPLASTPPASSPSPSTSTTTTSSSSQSESSGEVLGLAATGNLVTLITVFAVSLALIVVGIKRLLAR